MIKAIIGLGNPGKKFEDTRHNIGFKIIDQLANIYSADQFIQKDNLEYQKVLIDGNEVYLIKPLTFMNNSGQILPFLKNKSIKPEEVLVIHDELEKPVSNLSFKFGGSAKGHNGLKSLISNLGENFHRFRFGISRPENKEDVPDYVLSKFEVPREKLESLIDQSCQMIIEFVKNTK